MQVQLHDMKKDNQDEGGGLPHWGAGKTWAASRASGDEVSHTRWSWENWAGSERESRRCLTRHLSTLHGHPSPPSPLLPLASGLTLPSLFYLIIQGAARCLHLVLLLLRLAPSPAASQMWVASWDPGWQLEVSLAGGSRREGWWRCPGLILPYGLFVFPLASRPDLG